MSPRTQESERLILEFQSGTEWSTSIEDNVTNSFISLLLCILSFLYSFFYSTCTYCIYRMYIFCSRVRASRGYSVRWTDGGREHSVLRFAVQSEGTSADLGPVSHGMHSVWCGVVWCDVVQCSGVYCTELYCIVFVRYFQFSASPRVEEISIICLISFIVHTNLIKFNRIHDTIYLTWIRSTMHWNCWALSLFATQVILLDFNNILRYPI